MNSLDNFSPAKGKILVSNNHWANIGDAFYQNSIIHDLRQVYGGEFDVLSCDEHSCHIDPLLKFCHHNVFNYSLFGNCNWYVLSGPVLHKNFAKLYAPLLKTLHEKKIKVVFISAGGLVYDEEEISTCRQVLEAYPPFIFSTRDTETYRSYSDLAKYSYDGICSAFYSCLQYPGYNTDDLGEYIVYSFDKYTEPEIESLEKLDTWEWDIKIKNNSVPLRRLSRSEMLLDLFHKYPQSIENLKIIRLHHETLTKVTPLIYRRPNTFVSLNPYSYLNIIKNASLVLATRVHASVTALSYQKPTMLLVKTKRSYLFDRLGLQDILHKPVNIAADKIKEEHHKFISFLENIEF